MMEQNHQSISAEGMVQRMTHFVEHLQRDDHFDDQLHELDLPKLERTSMRVVCNPFT